MPSSDRKANVMTTTTAVSPRSVLEKQIAGAPSAPGGRGSSDASSAATRGGPARGQRCSARGSAIMRDAALRLAPPSVRASGGTSSPWAVALGAKGGVEQPPPPLVRRSLPPAVGRDAESINRLRFELAKPLYGRKSESARLREAFGRVCCRSTTTCSGGGNNNAKGGNAEVVLLSGRSGTGKSAVARGLSDELRRRRRISRLPKKGKGKASGAPAPGKEGDPPPPLDVFLAEGKFEAQRRTEPYGAVATAFSRLCGEILALRDDDGAMTAAARSHDAALFERLRYSIRAAVGGEAPVLSDVVPDLGLILDDYRSDSRSSLGVPPAASGEGGEVTAVKRDSFDGPRALNALKFALQRFARSVCDSSHPVVLVLDDLQWADDASLELIEALVTDRELSGLLLVGSYRDDDDGAVDSRRPAGFGSSRSIASAGDADDGDEAPPPLLKTLERIEKHGHGDNVMRVRVENLGLSAINDLIADILSLDADQTRDLAEVVHLRTHGNAFFAREFLISIHGDGMLRYCTTSLRWKWDVDEIKSGTSAANNVVDVMRDKLEKLPPDTKELVLVAACLGFAFDEATIVLVANFLRDGETGALLLEVDGVGRDGRRLLREGRKEREGASPDRATDVIDGLRICSEEGLLEVEEKDGSGDGTATATYRFIHDRVQEAAYSLIPDHYREGLSLRIGRILVSELADDDLERLLFLAVDHYNGGARLLLPPTAGDERGGSASASEEERASLAELNLRAGKKALEAAAFAASSAYLEMAISLMPSAHWNDERFEFSLDLFSTAAEADYCNGRFVQMRTNVDEVLGHGGCGILDKVRVYSVLMDYFFAEDRSLEAMRTSLELLAQLGVTFPSFGLKCAVVKNLLRTKSALKGHTASSLAELPLMEDEKKLVAMQVMDKLLTFCYLINPDLLPIVSFKMIRYSIKYGVSKYSPGAFVVYALIHIGVLNDFQMGKEYGDAAIAILERIGDKKYEPRVRFLETNFVRHWTKPAHNMYDLFGETYEAGMRTGDVQHGMLSVAMICHVALNLGKPLSLVESHCSVYCQQMQDHGQEKTRNLTIPLWQFALNMMGRSEDPTVLTGEAMDQEKLMAYAKDTKDLHLRDHILNHQMWLACFFRNYQLAWTLVQKTKDLRKNRMATYDFNRAALFKGVVLFAMARKTNKSSFKRRARKHMKEVQKWVEMGNANCLYFLRLFEAEDAALLGKAEEAKDTYFDAMTTAARFGFPQDRALIAERAGCFFLEVQGDVQWASHYMSLAEKLYREWGALAKSDQLKKMHPDLVSPEDTPVGDGGRRWTVHDAK